MVMERSGASTQNTLPVCVFVHSRTRLSACVSVGAVAHIASFPPRSLGSGSVVLFRVRVPDGAAAAVSMCVEKQQQQQQLNVRGGSVECGVAPLSRLDGPSCEELRFEFCRLAAASPLFAALCYSTARPPPHTHLQALEDWHLVGRCVGTNQGPL